MVNGLAESGGEDVLGVEFGNVKSAEEHSLGSGEIEEFAEPIEQEIVEIVGGDLEGELPGGLDGIEAGDDGEHAAGGIGKEGG